MIFTSIPFLFFFPTVAILYYSIPRSFQSRLLLLASAYFYMSFIPAYFLILMILISLGYGAGVLIETSQEKSKKLLLSLSCIIIGALLLVFKYFDFINSNVTHALGWAGMSNPVHNLSWIVPIGLSFQTFQSLSYVIDVYRGDVRAERRFGLYALYVMFFPLVVSGPIERADHLIPQLAQGHDLDYAKVIKGLQWMTWGFFLKLAIADRLGIFVDTAYAAPKQFPGMALIIATVCFSFQLYCDFAAYSIIAVGTALVLGIDLVQNFERPYLSESVAEFWRRWHISLMNWFRDYVFIPISMTEERASAGRQYVNVFIVFLLSGFWHGANWTFVVWGFIHGAYVVAGYIGQRAGLHKIDRLLPSSLAPLLKVFNIVLNFILVTYAWVFFRASSLSEALLITKKMAYALVHFHGSDIPQAVQSFELNRPELALGLFFVVVLVVIEWIQERHSIGDWISRQPAVMRWILYYSGIAVFLLFARLEEVKFIYFQF